MVILDFVIFPRTLMDVIVVSIIVDAVLGQKNFGCLTMILIVD